MLFYIIVNITLWFKRVDDFYIIDEDDDKTANAAIVGDEGCTACKK